MRVAIVGGGPGGLFFATLLRRADPSAEATVFERNRPDDAFGFGVVFSDRTLDGIHRADPMLRQALSSSGRHWDDIEIRVKGERIRCGGNGMAAVARRTLLALMQARAHAAGADLRFSSQVTLDDLADYDLVVAADGTGSKIRRQLEPDLGVSVDTAAAKFIWFGTDYLFDGLTFVHERGPHGVFAVHGYPISPDTSTFIVETDEHSWHRAGLDEFDVTQPPGASDMRSKRYLEELFADQIEGHRLLVNNSRWASFQTRRTRRWRTLTPQPVALLGDAVHTAHFSVGSGTKMAMEDAVELSQALTDHPGDLKAALDAYEQAAQPPVQKIQNSARPSLAWWEHFGDYYEAFEPWQFAYHFLSRSITDARLARRAPDFVDASHRAWTKEHGAEPLQTPFTHAGWASPGRVVEIQHGPFGPAMAVTGSGPGLQFAEDAPAGRAWGGLLAAPDRETELPEAFRELGRLAQQRPAVIAVHGGTPLTRTLTCEQARLHSGVPALLIDDGLDVDLAVTIVLSGRADLVGAPSSVLRAGGLLK